jgi:integrase
MGLGSLSGVSLAEARRLAAEHRETVARGEDPIEERHKKELAKQRAKEEEAARTKTFGDVAGEFIKSHEPGWRNSKHVAQWRMTIDVYARALKGKPVADVTTEDILAVLSPIWTKKPETASRLRGRIEQILDAAKAKGLRTGDNPAVWRGHLKLWLPKRDRSEDNHHAALPYESIPGFMEQVRVQAGLAPLALRFAILTAARSGEVLGAQWDEIDIEESNWIAPASRMKGKLEHRVPLSDRALEVLAEAGRFKTSNFVFPGRKADSPLSGMALEMVLRRMKIEGVTVHGMRSAFRDWAGNETHFARELAEHALAHRIGDKAEQAYRRGDALKRRRELMDAWAAYCEPRDADNVVQLWPGAA